MSSNSAKSMESDVKSIKSLLKQLAKDVQLISYRQLENETKTNELTKAKDEKSHISKKKNYLLMHLSLKIMILLGRE